MLSRTVHQASRPKVCVGSRASVKPICVRPSRFVARAAASEVDVKADSKPVVVDEAEDVPDVQPSTQEVEKFLSILVKETDIAELHLQVGSFELKVRRSTSGTSGYAPAAPAAAAASAAASEQEALPLPVMDSVKTLEESVDESLIYVPSPKVGIFRRGKYAGGKRLGKGNAVNEGDPVKKGQIMGYVEQLGTHVAVESPQAGEVIQFLIKEGDPVEYGQTVVEMAPFFGGHIIGDSKYA